MPGDIAAIPLHTLQRQIGELIDSDYSRCNPQLRHELMSIAEYLKDAQRWQYVRDNVIPPEVIASDRGILSYVDEKLK